MTAAALIIFMWPWGDDLWATPKMAVAATALAWWAVRKKTLHGIPNWQPWFAVFVALGASVVVSVDLGNSLQSWPRAMGMGWLQWTVAGLLFVQGLNAPPEAADKTVTAAACVCAAYAVCQFFHLELPFIRQHDLVNGFRRASTMGSPVFLGEVLVVTFPVALVMAGRRGQALVVLTLFVVAAAAAARCRSALIGLAVSLIYLTYKWER